MRRDENGNIGQILGPPQSTMILNNGIVKILAWHDNEWSCSARLVDCAAFMAGKGLLTEKERSAG
jgi:glyceraldehyde 3-phosphate dehydrogenase